MGFLGKLWHGVRHYGRDVGRGIGKAGRWAWKHRDQIIDGVGKAGQFLGTVGTALDATGIGAELGVPLGAVGAGLSGVASVAGELNQGFLGQSHKPEAFRNASKDPNSSLAHLPFEGKIASQGLSDHISNRVHPMSVINSSKDLINRIARTGKKTVGSIRNSLTRGMKRGRLGMPPPFFGNKRIKSKDSMARPPLGMSLGELNMRNYNSLPSALPSTTTRQFIEQRHRAKI